MTLADYLDQVRQGKILAEAPVYRGPLMATTTRPLSITDEPGALTAEAYKHGVFPLETDWEDALAEVEAAL